MIQLKRIDIRAFRSFHQVTLDLPSNGLMLIDGLNKDTSGSSGSGKTSIVEAVAYALGYSTIPASELQSRNINADLNVILTISTPKGDVEISRGAKNYLKYLTTDTKITGAKAISTEINSLIGLPTELVEALTYRPQRSFGRFISMTDSEKKEFLTNCLPELTEIENASEKARLEIAKLEDQKHTYELKIESLEEEQQRVATLVTHDVVDLEKLTAEIEATERDLKVKKEAIDVLVAAYAEERKEREKESDKLSAECAAARSKVQQFKSIVSSKGIIQGQVARLKQDLTKLEGNTCPTCEREWQSFQKIEETKNKIDELDKKLLVIQEAEVRLIDLEAQSNALHEKLNSFSLNSKSKFDEPIEQAKGHYNAIVAKISALQATKKAELTKKQQNEMIATAKLKIDANIRDYQSWLFNISTDIDKEKAVYLALGRQGYLGSIFDEILNEISSEVTEVLAKIPNVRSMSLKFVSESEGKTGVVRRSIVPLITKDGKEASFKSLSGGQQASVELAVDLAIGNVIGRRTGRTPGWMVLDEAFDGMDFTTKDNCMWLLKRYANDRLILVIDHSTEVKEGFDRSIKVVLENGVSTLA